MVKRLQVQFSLRAENVEFLRDLATEYDLSMSEILRVLISDFKENKANGKRTTATNKLEALGSDAIKVAKG